MRKITRLFLGLVAVAGIANCGSAMAQTSDAGTKFYRLDFEVKEIDLGKVVSSRAYSTMVSTEAGHGRDGGSIRAGTRVPININSSDSKEPNIQYMDVGVNIDCSAVRMTNGQISMAVTAEVSTLAVEPPREGPGMAAGYQPMTAPVPSKQRGTTSQKDGSDGTMPPPPPQAGDGEQPLRTPPPGARTNMMMASMRAPSIRQNRWMAVATVTPGKQTTLFASDDIATKRKMEVDVTATEVR
jgi:hypothetical protein